MKTADALAEFRARHAPAIEAELSRILSELPAGRLQGAMSHAVRAGGKRLRPLLCLAAHEAAGGDPAQLYGPACALELLHTYSLVHDDLPAMDDDDLRRGQPTVHKAFDEATAILAGDALHTLAFEIMAKSPEGEAHAARRAAAAQRLARASGASGMALGQMLDLEAEGKPGGTLQSLTALHRLKTGALIQAAAAIGAIHAGAEEATLCHLDDYGAATGLAFQIADDLLDTTADSATLGKTAGKDLAQDKLTYVKLLGLDGARDAARAERDKAIAALASANLKDSSVLSAIADYAIERKN
jgi:farnesyl diphosphate synthase